MHEIIFCTCLRSVLWEHYRRLLCKIAKSRLEDKLVLLENDF